MTDFAIPTEPIGSIPRSPELIDAMQAHRRGDITDTEMDYLYDSAVRDTIRRFELTGSPVLTDGEQRKYHNFASYCVDGCQNFAPNGFRLQFVNHYREWPRLTSGPFQYGLQADRFLSRALDFTALPVKQAVISPSALSLFYPTDDLLDYSRDDFLRDLLIEHEKEVRSCLRLGAHTVQIDFTEGRLAHKLDPSGDLLQRFVQLNNLALARFSEADRKRLGVHTCPGGDRDSTHSADVDYLTLLPQLFELRVSRFFVAMASERDPDRALGAIRDLIRPGHQVFVGVIDPLDPRVETPEIVRDRILHAAQYIPLHQLGTTDDCGFAPFSDDLSTSRDTAFAKIEARVAGTRMASQLLGRHVSAGSTPMGS